ncbi:Uncharacterised protein [Burkholderia pseudomallei]|nr:Uncharacterised protein [Burkholderia pseudomallei]
MVRRDIWHHRDRRRERDARTLEEYGRACRAGRQGSKGRTEGFCRESRRRDIDCRQCSRYRHGPIRSVAPALSRYARRDFRIRVVLRWQYLVDHKCKRYDAASLAARSRFDRRIAFRVAPDRHGRQALSDLLRRGVRHRARQRSRPVCPDRDRYRAAARHAVGPPKRLDNPHLQVEARVGGRSQRADRRKHGDHARDRDRAGEPVPRARKGGNRSVECGTRRAAGAADGRRFRQCVWREPADASIAAEHDGGRPRRRIRQGGVDRRRKRGSRERRAWRSAPDGGGVRGATSCRSSSPIR